MIQYDKPFMTYDELIVKMESKGILVINKDFAKDVLSTCSYYNLINRYQHVFKHKTIQERFREGTTFEEIYTVYTLDTALASILLKYILYIERSLKSKLSYVIAERYGVNDQDEINGLMVANSYLKRTNYSNSHNFRDTILRAIKEVLDYSRNTEHINSNRKIYISSSLRHYATNHNHVPPWILVTSLSFGLATKWYSILRAADKTRIVNSFIRNPQLTEEDKKEYLKTSIDLMRCYRNTLAHGGKTTDIEFGRIPQRQCIHLSNGLLCRDDFIGDRINQSGVQIVICILLSLINDQYMENALVQDIINLFWLYRPRNTDSFGSGIWDDLGLSGDFMDGLLRLYDEK